METLTTKEHFGILVLFIMIWFIVYAWNKEWENGKEWWLWLGAGFFFWLIFEAFYWVILYFFVWK